MCALVFLCRQQLIPNCLLSFSPLHPHQHKIRKRDQQEDKQNKSLQYACRLCRYTEPTPDQPLIYRNDLKKEVTNILHTVPGAIADDPTLARSQNAKCPNCEHHEAVFFQSDIAQADSLALIFVCCSCAHKWVN